MKIGCSRVSITPLSDQKVISLGGEQLSIFLNDDIYVNVILIKLKTEIVLFIVYDLIWVDKELCEKIFSAIYNRFSIHSKNIIITSTHAHSTPQLSNIIGYSEFVDAGYVSLLLEKTLVVVEKAFGNLLDCYAVCKTSHTTCNISRRKKVFDLHSFKKLVFSKKTLNRPNKKANIDNEITTIYFYNYDGPPIGCLMNYAAHPTLVDRRYLSADYPGHISRLNVCKYRASFVTCFMQGFSGDVKANIVTKGYNKSQSLFKNIYFMIFDRHHFKKGLTFNNVNIYASKLLDAVDNFNAIKNVNITQILFNNVEVDLPTIDGVRKLSLSAVFLKPNIMIITSNAELFSYYSLWVKSYFKKSNLIFIIAGYSNGMVGYIPDANAVRDGGYEVDRALHIFNQESRYSENVEICVKKGLISLLNKFNVKNYF